MKFENSYLGTPERVELVEDYILHEVHKFGATRYSTALQKIKARISEQHVEVYQEFLETLTGDDDAARDSLNRISLSHKWMLFHAISYGILRKQLFNCVGCDRLNWKKTTVMCSELRFESKINFVHDIETKYPFCSDVIQLAQTKDEQFLKDRNANYAETGAVDRKNNPIICRKKRNGILIHDGAGRVLLHCCRVALKEVEINAEIPAWIGERRPFNLKDRLTYMNVKRTLFPVKRNSHSIS